MTEAADMTCGAEHCQSNGTYTVHGECPNCGWAGTVTLTRGHKAPHLGRCPSCDCRTLYTRPSREPRL